MKSVVVARVSMRDGPVLGLGHARVARLARDEGWGLVEGPDLAALIRRRPRLALLVLEVGELAKGVAHVHTARESFPTIGIVLWGPVGSPECVVAALQSGADDVVGDWMLGNELVARIRRLVPPRGEAPRSRAVVSGTTVASVGGQTAPRLIRSIAQT